MHDVCIYKLPISDLLLWSYTPGRMLLCEVIVSAPCDPTHPLPRSIPASTIFNLNVGTKDKLFWAYRCGLLVKCAVGLVMGAKVKVKLNNYACRINCPRYFSVGMRTASDVCQLNDSSESTYTRLPFGVLGTFSLPLVTHIQTSWPNLLGGKGAGVLWIILGAYVVYQARPFFALYLLGQKGLAW